MSESALADVNSPSARFHLTISAFATTITRYSVVCCLFHRTVYTSLTFFSVLALNSSIIQVRAKEVAYPSFIIFR